jgi:hypothetical protein
VIAETVEMPMGWALQTLPVQSMLTRQTAGDLLRALMPKSIVDVVRAFLAFERALAPHIGNTYARDRVEGALEDEAVAKAHDRIIAPAFWLARRFRWLAKSRPSWMFSSSALGDDAVRTQVELAARANNEFIDAFFWLLRRGTFVEPSWAPASSTPPEERDANRLWFASDPAIPAELARRLIAGKKANLVVQMAGTARRSGAWSTQDQRLAAKDWADWTMDHAGLIASILGITLRALPASHRFDHEHVMRMHREARERFAAMAGDASRALDK